MQFIQIQLILYQFRISHSLQSNCYHLNIKLRNYSLSIPIVIHKNMNIISVML